MRLRATSLAVGAGLGIGCGIYLYKDSRSAVHKYLVLPAGRILLDGESAHLASVLSLKWPLVAPRAPRDWFSQNDPSGKLVTTLFSHCANSRVKPLVLRSPVGVAAGFDKNAEAVDGLFNLGFSLVECGSVTPEPQAGNPQPRVFRLLEDLAIINRYGFNSEGHNAVAARLKKRLAKNLPKLANYNHSLRPGGGLAVNLGKNKTGHETNDYVQGIRMFGELCDVLVINVSSPNTPGLRDLQRQDKLQTLLSGLVQERDRLKGERVPALVVKVAPDLSDCEIASVAGAIKQSGVDGVIVGNTTVQRPAGLTSALDLVTQAGGLSGKPLKPIALRAVKSMRQHLGPKHTVIGCGGILSGQDANEFLAAGADCVQLYTGLAYEGVGIPVKISEELIQGRDQISNSSSKSSKSSRNV